MMYNLLIYQIFINIKSVVLLMLKQVRNKQLFHKVV